MTTVAQLPVAPSEEAAALLRARVVARIGMRRTEAGYRRTMDPIPETASLIDELSTFYDADLLGDLQRQAEAVRELVPDLVGLSVAAFRDDVTFTLVASDHEVAVLDALQYLAGGPCVDAVPAERVLEYDFAGPDDERHWHAFAKASAAKAVATTLTLPILDGKTVVGTVNLYAAASGSFRGLHREIADIFHAWAPGAVTNADLSFETRRIAEEAPDRLHAKMWIDGAVRLLMSERAIDADAARELIEQAARRAGVTTQDLARTMIESFGSDEG